MIERVWSDLPGFKRLDFGPGLNILLADRAEGSSERDTRNGAGKSSFVELVHFLLAANADQDSIFRGAALGDASFSMRMTVPEGPPDADARPGRLTVTRSGAAHSKIGLETGWPGKSEPLKTVSETTVAELRHLLGTYLFGIPEDAGNYGPSARSLLGYFARRVGGNGFNEAFKHTTLQQLVDVQVNVSYLLGLDWTIPRDLEAVRRREKELKEVRRAARAGMFGLKIGNLAEMRTEIVLAGEHADRLRADLDQFQVVDHYRDLQRRADVITETIRAVNDSVTLLRRYEAELRQALQEETPPPLDDLRAVYAEAGVLLPDTVLARFEEVRAFHESVVQNRRTHLESEARRTTGEIADQLGEIATLDRQRSEVMQVLESGGALETFRALQDDLAREEAGVAALRASYEAGRELEGGMAETRLTRQRLLERLQLDHQEREAILAEAIVAFRDLSGELYEGLQGQLVVGTTENGPNFDVRISGERSRGITSMQIFCVDMTFARLAARNGRSPGFLIHDSHIFDGVDSRQVASAMRLASRAADEYGYQHIVTLNSDTLPEAAEDFDPAAHVLPTVLTDEHVAGGLFGLRFA